jgi:hypothetical protein
MKEHEFLKYEVGYCTADSESDLFQLLYNAKLFRQSVVKAPYKIGNHRKTIAPATLERSTLNNLILNEQNEESWRDRRDPASDYEDF